MDTGDNNYGIGLIYKALGTETSVTLTDDQMNLEDVIVFLEGALRAIGFDYDGELAINEYDREKEV